MTDFTSIPNTGRGLLRINFGTLKGFLNFRKDLEMRQLANEGLLLRIST